jgi:hypothetical protein
MSDFLLHFFQFFLNRKAFFCQTAQTFNFVFEKIKKELPYDIVEQIQIAFLTKLWSKSLK